MKSCTSYTEDSDIRVGSVTERMLSKQKTLGLVLS